MPLRDAAGCSAKIVKKKGYDRLYARFRKQYAFLPPVEFECPAVAEPLRMLLRETLIQADDNILIVGWNDFRAFAIRDALEQLGEPLGRERSLNQF